MGSAQSSEIVSESFCHAGSEESDMWTEIDTENETLVDDSEDNGEYFKPSSLSASAEVISDVRVSVDLSQSPKDEGEGEFEVEERLRVLEESRPLRPRQSGNR